MPRSVRCLTIWLLHFSGENCVWRRLEPCACILYERHTDGAFTAAQHLLG